VFENRVLRRIFGPKREEVTEGSEEVLNSYCLPRIIRINKSRRLGYKHDM
jgi:hypothetical protein